MNLKQEKRQEIKQVPKIEARQNGLYDINCLDFDKYETYIDMETFQFRTDGGKIKRRNGCS